jgi:hypothetical protein
VSVQEQAPDPEPGSPWAEAPAVHWPVLRPYMQQQTSRAARERPALGLTAQVQASVRWEEVEMATKTYTARIDGELVQRRRAFGLEDEHLVVLQLCQEPMGVADIAAALGQDDPQGEPAEDELAMAAADVSGPPGLPLGYTRAVLDDLIDHGLIKQAREPDLNDPELYRALLSMLDTQGYPPPTDQAERHRGGNPPCGQHDKGRLHRRRWWERLGKRRHRGLTA